MIDFRYHIVSLISVFLALAVGIILGAGPLKETIGNQLTGQVEQLREEKEAIRADFDAEAVKNKDLNDYISAASKRVTQGTLTDRRIAVIQITDTPDALYDELQTEVENAGGTLTARITLDSAWADADQADSRQSYATSLMEFLPEEFKDLPAEKALAAALVMSLSQSSPTDADALSQNAALALDVLDAADLIHLVSYTPLPVDAVIVLDANSLPPASDGLDDAGDVYAQSNLWANVAEAAARQTEGVVVSTVAMTESNLVATIRASASLVKTVATVSDFGQPVGQLNTPLALAAAIGNKVGHFGFEGSATALVPAPVTLPEVDRSVEPPVDETVDPDNPDAAAVDPDNPDAAATDGEPDAPQEN